MQLGIRCGIDTRGFENFLEESSHIMDNITFVEDDDINATSTTNLTSPIRIDQNSNRTTSTLSDDNGTDGEGIEAMAQQSEVQFKLWTSVVMISETELRKNPYYYR